jgi:cell division initiation protein
MQNMEITPRELRDVEIKESLRGYNRDEVNDLLERAAATLEAANDRVRQLTERLSSAQTEAGRTRETEDILHRTLLLAQRAADEAVAEATAKARQMVDDAEIQSRRTIADSEAEARRRGETERQRLEKQVVELAGRRDALLADVEAMNRFESEYRERMVRALEADLTALRTRPSTAPGSRPEVTEVEIPVLPEPVARREQATPPAREQLPEEPEDEPAPEDEPVPDLAHVPDPQPMPVEDRSPSTREVDVRSLFEANDDVPPSEPVPAHSYDLLGPDALDSEVLDDDAFFATLRDAVHDEAPLGPRGEDDITPDRHFFDQDADRGSFRDVFRRRR